MKKSRISAAVNNISFIVYYAIDTPNFPSLIIFLTVWMIWEKVRWLPYVLIQRAICGYIVG